MTMNDDPHSRPTHPDTVSGKMAAFAADLRYEDLPADVRERAQLVLLDALGCALAGAATEDLQLIRQAMQSAAGVAGDSLLWGTADHAPLPLAALANGAAIHAREMDDFEGCLHSGSAVIPAAFGTAVRVGCSGPELLTAIILGYDIARRALEGVRGQPAAQGPWLAFNRHLRRVWRCCRNLAGVGAGCAAHPVGTRFCGEQRGGHLGLHARSKDQGGTVSLHRASSGDPAKRSL